MTYEEIISVLSEEIREKRAWPENGSADKLAQQLRIIYTVTVTIAQQLPLSILSDSLKTSDLTGTEVDDYYTSELPDDLFFVRPLLGIELLEFGSKEIYRPAAGMNLRAFTRMAADQYQFGNIFFHVNATQRKLYFHGASTCKVHYVPLFTEPTSSNYDSTDFPLPEPYSAQAIQMTAQHVNSILTGKRGLASVNNVFAKLYGSGAEMFVPEAPVEAEVED